MNDYSTHSIDDAAISAGFDAYDDRALDRPSRADLEAEAEWWRHFKARTDAGIEEIDPHAFPEAARGPLLEALRASLCDLCGVRAGTDHGLCEKCTAVLREEA